jgi:hypothetical protein
MGIQKDTTVGRPELIRRVAISSVWLIVSTLLAMFVPNITTVISVIGGLAGLIIFFFPGIQRLLFIFIAECSSTQRGTGSFLYFILFRFIDVFKKHF